MSYKQKLSVNFFALFAVFTLSIIFIQYSREKSYKIDQLKSNLMAYTTIIDNYVADTLDFTSLEPMSALLPDELRVTVLNREGKVFFDNNDEGVEITDNHLGRPEIRTADVKGMGVSVRVSSSTGVEYYYLATRFDPYFVRVALPYDVNAKELLKSNNLYIYLIVALFVVFTFTLVFISDKMGRSISTLRDLAFSLTKGNMNKNFAFPEGELGEIGGKLVDIYRAMQRSKDELRTEKDKLIQHFTHSAQGIAFFSSRMESIYYNSLFISHLNSLSDQHTLNIEEIFDLEEFKTSIKFITSGRVGVNEDIIKKNGQIFNLRTIVFEDRSVEFILNNVTREEKNRILKQEMTSNIAHELRTPVSSISGYLETLMEQKSLPEDKRNQFIERAYSQVLRLSGLIRDISVITHLESGKSDETKVELSMRSLTDEVINELSSAIKKRNSRVINNISSDVRLHGNSNLLYSVYRNLIDNAINYAGEDVTIKLGMFFEDDKYYHFTVSDNGRGVDEEHLTKIFNRFYRVSEGRTRTDGGSGLGLSIVKNAVKFHGGVINAKKSKEGGLEIVFSIMK